MISSKDSVSVSCSSFHFRERPSGWRSWLLRPVLRAVVPLLSFLSSLSIASVPSWFLFLRSLSFVFTLPLLFSLVARSPFFPFRALSLLSPSHALSSFPFTRALFFPLCARSLLSPSLLSLLSPSRALSLSLLRSLFHSLCSLYFRRRASFFIHSASPVPFLSSVFLFFHSLFCRSVALRYVLFSCRRSSSRSLSSSFLSSLSSSSFLFSLSSSSFLFSLSSFSENKTED